MEHYKYLIVGGGMTADSAVRGIREVDAEGRIGLVGSESEPPYSRPPLTKGLWKGKPFESVWLGTGEHGAELHLGRSVERIDVAARQVVDDAGTAYGYERLLLATGGTPRRLGADAERVTYFRTVEDYLRVRELALAGMSFAVIGGGFIGSEIAAALAMSGCRVTLLFPDDGISARLFPADLARFVADYYVEKGVDVRAGETVSGITEIGARMRVTTESGAAVDVDHVVAGLGITPNVALAEAAGLTVDDGVVVDERLKTSRPDIYAAGDVARFGVPALGHAIRVEHEDNALTMGRAAGRSMAGDDTPYEHLPYFYSDLFELGYEAVGDMDPRGQTFADWKDPMREGVVYYLTGGRVRGVLLWNTWDQVDAARALIAEAGPFTAADLKGRLPA